MWRPLLWFPVKCCPSSQIWLRTRLETHTMWIPANCLLCVLLYVSCMLWPAPDLTSHFPLLSFPVWRPNFCMYIGLHACTWSDISRALLISVSAFTELEHFMVGFSDSDWASSDLEHRMFMTRYSVSLCGGPIALEKLPPDHRGQNNHWSRILCLDELFLMKWHLWNSYCLNWVSRLKPSQSTKTAKLQSTWLAILSNTSESSILTYGITLSARRCWRDGHRTEDPHKSQPFDMYTKAVSKVVFDTLSLFIVCRTETLWWYYGHYYSKDIFMIYAILLILDVVCDETRERYCSDLDDMSQVSFMCSLNTGGVLTWNLGSSKLNCASTGEHAERSASRIRCLKSRSVFY